MGLLGEDRSRATVERRSGAGPVQVWPSGSVRRGATAAVPGEHVLVLADGDVVLGSLGPGTHVLDPDEHLCLVPEGRPDRRVLSVTVYLIDTAAQRDRHFSGRLDDVEDPSTGATVALAVAGVHRVRFAEPANVVTRLAHRVDLTNPAAVDYWLTRQLLWGVRRAVTTEAASHRRGLLELDDTTLTGAAVDHVTRRLAGSGIELVALDELEVRAERGPSTGLDGTTGPLGGLSSFGLPVVRCTGCGASAPGDARFCPRCGAGIERDACPRCSAGVLPGARFCTTCGMPVDPGP